MTLPEWQKIDDTLEYRQDRTSGSGDKFQLKYTQTGVIVTAKLLPKSEAKLSGALDSVTIYDGNPDNKSHVMLGFTPRGDLVSRITTDYAAGGMCVTENAEIHSQELDLIRPLYENTHEALQMAQKKLGYHPRAKRKPLAYISDRLYFL
jgi:hypothetical protein